VRRARYNRWRLEPIRRQSERSAILALATLVALGIGAGTAAASAWQPPPPVFPDVTADSGIEAPMHTWEPRQGPPEGLLDRLPPASPAVGDVNDDGYADVFLPVPGYADDELQAERDTRSRLLLNDHSPRDDETFLEVTDVAGLDVDDHAYAASWTDVEDDGDLDLLVAGYGFVRLLVQGEDMTFEVAGAEAGLPQDGLVTGASWGDVDADGDLDLFLTRYTTTAGDQPAGRPGEVPGARNALLLDTADGFQEATDAAGFDTARRSTGAALVDVDVDGDLDVHVTNDGEANTLWINQGHGTFAERAEAHGVDDEGASTCQVWSDLDADGDLDLLVGNGAGEAASLHLATGDGFAPAPDVPGLEATVEDRTWGCGAADFDNDADVDVLLANSETTDPQGQRLLLLENEAWRFPEEPGLASLGPLAFNATHAIGDLGDRRATSGIALHDFNLDGESAVDVLTTNHDLDRARLFRSVGWQGGWAGGNGEFLRVWLEGPDGGKAPAVGARVTVEAGQVSTTKLAGAGSSWGGGSLTELVFGLGKPERHGYDGQGDVSVTVEWPDGTVETYPDVWSRDRATAIVKGQGYRNDTVAPKPSLNLIEGQEGDDGWYRSSPVTLSLTARESFAGGNRGTGIDTLAYSRDGENWTAVDSPSLGTRLSFAGQGTHKLWVRAADEAGNEAVTVYPVRLDATDPAASIRDPAPGAAYVQGERVASLGSPLGTHQSVVLAPQDAAPNPDGSRDLVRTDAADATAGVEAVDYEVARVAPPPATFNDATRHREGFLWQWPVEEEPAGEFQLTATVRDDAGNTVDRTARVLVAPTTPSGLSATLDTLPGPRPSDPLIDRPWRPST
jgi:hypothetical protein